jgi:hypothetical protein
MIIRRIFTVALLLTYGLCAKAHAQAIHEDFESGNAWGVNANASAVRYRSGKSSLLLGGPDEYAEFSHVNNPRQLTFWQTDWNQETDFRLVIDSQCGSLTAPWIERQRIDYTPRSPLSTTARDTGFRNQAVSIGDLGSCRIRFRLDDWRKGRIFIDDVDIQPLDAADIATRRVSTTLKDLIEQGIAAQGVGAARAQLAAQQAPTRDALRALAQLSADASKLAAVAGLPSAVTLRFERGNPLAYDEFTRLLDDTLKKILPRPQQSYLESLKLAGKDAFSALTAASTGNVVGAAVSLLTSSSVNTLFSSLKSLFASGFSDFGRVRDALHIDKNAVEDFGVAMYIRNDAFLTRLTQDNRTVLQNSADAQDAAIGARSISLGVDSTIASLFAVVGIPNAEHTVDSLVAQVNTVNTKPGADTSVLLRFNVALSGKNATLTGATPFNADAARTIVSATYEPAARLAALQVRFGQSVATMTKYFTTVETELCSTAAITAGSENAQKDWKAKSQAAMAAFRQVEADFYHGFLRGVAVPKLPGCSLTT